MGAAFAGLEQERQSDGGAGRGKRRGGGPLCSTWLAHMSNLRAEWCYASSFPRRCSKSTDPAAVRVMALCGGANTYSTNFVGRASGGWQLRSHSRRKLQCRRREVMRRHDAKFADPSKAATLAPWGRLNRLEATRRCRCVFAAHSQVTALTARDNDNAKETVRLPPR